MKRFLLLCPWFALLAFPLVEVSAHAITRSRVPKLRDWQAAAAYVKPRVGPRDLVSVAPAWADPLLREVLGAQIDLPMAGRSDTSFYERLWSLSIRGARPAEAPPDETQLLEQRAFGRVQVALWSLGKSRVRFDFARELARAEVSVLRGDGERACEWRTQRAGRGGALGAGVLAPRDRFVCKGEGVWVAPVVMEDLDLQPRYCVYQPALGQGGRLRVRFREVPLGDQLVLYAGVYYEHERMREGGPIELHVNLDGRRAAALTHRDGDGWKRLALPTARGTAELGFEVTANEPRRRHFCWSATTRDGSAR